jgi:hypothetical protein
MTTVLKHIRTLAQDLNLDHSYALDRDHNTTSLLSVVEHDVAGVKVRVLHWDMTDNANRDDTEFEVEVIDGEDSEVYGMSELATAERFVNAIRNT